MSDLVEKVAQAIKYGLSVSVSAFGDPLVDDYDDAARAAIAAIEASGTHRVVPVEPTEAQLDAARDWSAAKYGKPVGNDGTSGCYVAMLAAAPKVAT